MRSALIVLSLAVFIAPAIAVERVPRLPTATSYGDARISLSALGWKPAPAKRADGACSIGREDVCDQFPEAAFCSGTGLARCIFLWSKGGSLIEVGTTGEDVADLRVERVKCRSDCP